MARHALLIVSSPLLAAACFDELGSYEPASGGNGGEQVDRDTPSSPASTTTVVTSTTGSGGAAPEACTNGLDDDADGKVDCEDEDCGGYQCVPAPSDPAFSGGPLLLLPAASGAPCGPAFPTAGLDGVRLLAAPSPCDCTCGAATGQACQATVTTHTSPSCAGAGGATAVGAACVTGAGAASVSAAVAPAGGACAGSPVPPVAPSFEPARTCQAERGGGCGGGHVCARPPAPSDGLVCFERPGDTPCDDPTYPIKVLVFDDEPIDGRTCSGTCSCDPPEGGSCAGALTVRDGSCAGALVGSLSLGEACEDLTSPTAVSGLSLSATVAAPGSCTPNHRTESGTLEGSAHTLCCAEAL